MNSDLVCYFRSAACVAVLSFTAMATEWKSLAPGIDYGAISFVLAPESGDGLLHVVRIDPRMATLEFALASQENATLQTARTWCETKGFVAAINAGMYAEDYLTNVGYLRADQHLNNKAWKRQYQSVLVFGPLHAGLAEAQIIDRDNSEAFALVGKYRFVVQNLRALKGSGTSVWKPNGKSWSEAMVAQDSDDRILFLFSQTPLEMAALNEKLTALPLGIIRAMHMDGGPPASLSICASSMKIDLAGVYETGFFGKRSVGQRRIPNVLGVRSHAKQ